MTDTGNTPTDTGNTPTDTGNTPTRERSSFIAWCVASAIWSWFFYGVGGLVATGVFADPTTAQRLTGAVLAGIALFGPGLSGTVLAHRLDRPRWRTASVVILMASPLASASVYWWDSWVFF